MAGISGQGTTYNLPNYVGPLFGVSPEDTPFLSAIGGLTGGKRATAVVHEWSTYDLRDATTNNVQLEGATAPTAVGRVRARVANVLEIHQSKVDVSYSKLAATGSTAAASVTLGTNPVADEMAWQVRNELAAIARDIEKSFISGAQQIPSDNSTARKTRGIQEATSTNVSDIAGTAVTLSTSADADDIVDTATAHGFSAGDQVKFTALTGGSNVSTETTYYVISANLAAQTFQIATTRNGSAVNFGSNITAGTVVKLGTLTEAYVLGLLQTVWENGGIREQETATIMANAWGKRMLSKIFITDKGYSESTRNVGGVNVQTIETDFGRLNVMLNRYIPVHSIQVVSLEQCAPVFLEVPGKGFLFLEPLAKTGASEASQIYGEVGLEYGNELAHGKITSMASQTQAA
jgi:hypothetical protein